MFQKKICLIGYGYWGKILEKNLIEIGFTDITIVDESFKNLNLVHEGYDLYFIATPFSTHFEILEKVCNYQGKLIWCEKPLVSNLDDLYHLYEISEKNRSKIFVDWVYLYNPGVNFLKGIIQETDIFQIILNRTNDGPIRSDCDSRWDLSTHDLSIIFCLFENVNMVPVWNEFSIKTGERFGSNLSHIFTEKFQIIINSSWQHSEKNRTSIFVTKKIGTIIMDDLSKKIIIDGKVAFDFSETSPLKNSILTFVSNKSEDFEYNKGITIKITSILDGKI
jgi:predicted dehydrogenase